MHAHKIEMSRGPNIHHRHAPSPACPTQPHAQRLRHTTERGGRLGEGLLTLHKHTQPVSQPLCALEGALGWQVGPWHLARQLRQLLSLPIVRLRQRHSHLRYLRGEPLGILSVRCTEPGATSVQLGLHANVMRGTEVSA